MHNEIFHAFAAFCGSLIQVIESRKLPPGPSLLEVIDYDFVPGCVRTRDTEVLRIFRVHLNFGLTKTSRGIGLFVEDLSIALAELGLRLDGRNSVRHREWKLGQARDCLNVAFADRGPK